MTPTASSDPGLCDADPPHPMIPVGDGFAYCPECGMLFTRQPGAWVWVYDPWAVRLAEALARTEGDVALARLGLDADALTAIDLPPDGGEEPAP